VRDYIQSEQFTASVASFREMGAFTEFVMVCLLGLFVVASSAAESNVADLTTSNFDSFLKENELALVEFFAPWCGHCKNLAPEYEKAADELKASGSSIKLAKVDSTVETELADRFKIQGYPTLKWFKNGQPTEYNGPREAAGIVSWVTKKSGPVVHTVSTKEEFDKLVKNKKAVVGFFEKGSDAQKAFHDAADIATMDPFASVEITSEELAKEVGQEINTVVLYREHAEPIKFEGEISKEAIANFATAHGYPYFESAQLSWSRHTGRGLEYVLLIVADTKADSWSDINTFAHDLAKEFIDKVGFAWVGAEFFDRVAQFGLSGKHFPAAAILAPQRQKNYVHEEGVPLTRESIKGFVEGVLEGTIKPHFKSEAVPEKNDDPVTVVVGNTFEELVVNNDKDVFIEFYAPWCGHCKSLAPIWEELGDTFFENENIVIAKMDSTANDNDYVPIKSFPTLVFFKAGQKDTPITYSGPRNLDDLVKFVKKEATNPTTLAAGERDEL